MLPSVQTLILQFISLVQPIFHIGLGENCPILNVNKICVELSNYMLNVMLISAFYIESWINNALVIVRRTFCKVDH